MDCPALKFQHRKIDSLLKKKCLDGSKLSSSFGALSGMATYVVPGLSGFRPVFVQSISCYFQVDLDNHKLTLLILFSFVDDY